MQVLLFLSKRRTIVTLAVAAFVVIGAAAFAPAAAASADPPVNPADPPGPPVILPVQAQVHRVSVDEALAAARRPGAVTEMGPVTVVDPDPCWSVTVGVRWGLSWPFFQYVYAHDYWCAPALGAGLSYRSTYVTLDGVYCSSHDPYSYRVAGGLGYTTVEYVAGGYFDCPSDIPWITWHYNRWHQDELSTWGGAWVVSTS